PPDPMQAKLMKIMPIAFSVFFFFFPSGLVLYWLVNNILSIAQQWRITHVVERAKTAHGGSWRHCRARHGHRPVRDRHPPPVGPRPEAVYLGTARTPNRAAPRRADRLPSRRRDGHRQRACAVFPRAALVYG